MPSKIVEHEEMEGIQQIHGKHMAVVGGGLSLEALIAKVSMHSFRPRLERTFSHVHVFAGLQRGVECMESNFERCHEV